MLEGNLALDCNIGIKIWFFMHQVPWELANVNALKNHVRLLLLHKNWKHLLHFALFLALFCFTFSLMSRELISTDYARLRAGQRTSRTGSKSMALVRSYWKLRSRALTWIALLIHVFSPVNARLLIMCDTAFNAIMLFSSLSTKCSWWASVVSQCPSSVVLVRRGASTIALKAYSSYTPGPIDLILGRKHRGDLWIKNS